eukprot:Nitzschia sp. Nitz4//scaffold228_size32365//27475//28452//NITZ4_007910-RA/size32365-processed-gene-0.34-mRNA-1//1//CDS//3329542831//5753//frame0
MNRTISGGRCWSQLLSSILPFAASSRRRGGGCTRSFSSLAKRLPSSNWHLDDNLTYLANYSSNHHHHNNNNNPNPTTHDDDDDMKLICLRHGVSVANEWMEQPGNEWGSPNFQDNEKADAELSERGRHETSTYVAQQIVESTDWIPLLKQVELVLVSPLTRCLETYQYGVKPLLYSFFYTPLIPPVVALPLLRERVYTTSDTGRPVGELQKAFPDVDFSLCPADPSVWWYTGEEYDGQDGVYEEWRPHGEQQWYGVLGEPEAVFEARMRELDKFLASRPEQTILIVSHWGVLRHLSNGTEWKNAELKMVEHTMENGKRRCEMILG